MTTPKDETEMYHNKDLLEVLSDIRTCVHNWRDFPRYDSGDYVSKELLLSNIIIPLLTVVTVIVDRELPLLRSGLPGSDDNCYSFPGLPEENDNGQ